jgi:hypothetical protein
VGYTPVGLITQHQSLQDRRGGVFNLRPGERKFVEVAALNEAEPTADIELQYEHKDYENKIPRGFYKLTVSAYGSSSPTMGIFNLYVDEAGRLRLEPATDSSVGAHTTAAC